MRDEKPKKCTFTIENFIMIKGLGSFEPNVLENKREAFFSGSWNRKLNMQFGKEETVPENAGLETQKMHVQIWKNHYDQSISA